MASWVSGQDGQHARAFSDLNETGCKVVLSVTMQHVRRVQKLFFSLVAPLLIKDTKFSKLREKSIGMPRVDSF